MAERCRPRPGRHVRRHPRQRALGSLTSQALHASWRRLLDISGPFLSLPVLARAFPQGLEDAGPTDRLRAAYDEWREGQEGAAPDTELHRVWIRFVMGEVLGFDDEVLREGQGISTAWTLRIAEHREELRPDFAVVTPPGREGAGLPRFLVQFVPFGIDLERTPHGSRWNESPAGRMAILLRGTGARLGLLTDGERWMLVDAPRQSAQQLATTGFTSWYASLWLEERDTLRAFQSLLGRRRFFGVAENETLESLLAASAVVEQDVTDQLGRQVRRAVEILVSSLDRIDRDRGGALLRDVTDRELYESAVTVMMRLVFLFCAEERRLFPVDEELYGGTYAAGTLREQLSETAEQWGEEVLERRTDAWQRLLALFRLVQGGAQHEDLRLPPYGGRLFDPDRFPFLEGRAKGTTWREEPAQPLPIDNRTVLHLLEALQLVRHKKSQGALRVSFLALDVEQIGHVYEGLLDHTVKRADGVVLGLKGKEGDEPEVSLTDIEARSPALPFLAETTGKTPKAIQKLLDATLTPEDEHLFLVACGNDRVLWTRVKQWAGLVRADVFGRPAVILAGSRYMTSGTDRRQTGTQYTPRALAEEVVLHALEPLVYEGPAEGVPRESWALRPAAALLALKVCDMACGSGAFLVATCRYLANRLVEAWKAAEAANPGQFVVTPEGRLADGSLTECLVPRDDAERLVYAQRIVAARCLYGVDINDLAAEMARLSLWLITLDKGKPFTFLDHAIKTGDSLLGVTSLEQLEAFSLDPTSQQQRFLFLGDACRRALAFLASRRGEIEATPSLDIRDVETKERILRESETVQVRAVRWVGDVLMHLRLAELGGVQADRTELEEALAHCFEAGIDSEEEAERRIGRLVEVFERFIANVPRAKERNPFHWPVEFPEVFGVEPADRGFDAIVGNPPFLGGQRITGALGTDYRDHLVKDIADGRRGSADLCAYFFLRAAGLLRDGGIAGLVATNTIAQGDTREVGLDALIGSGRFSIARAVPSRKWPGEASLEVAHVWLRNGEWKGERVLDEQPVRGIGPMLSVPGRVAGKPYRLAANAGKSFQGSIVLGMGFVLSPSETEALIQRDERNRDVLFPYLNGEDLNTRSDQSASRWVINFFDWPLDRASAPAGYTGPVAADYPECLAIVREKVKPERERNKRAQRRDRWWQYAERAPALYAAIAGMERVLAICLVTQHVGIAAVPTRQVFAHRLAIFRFDAVAVLALLQSSLYEPWARQYSSSLETRLNFSPSDCFETFPFPPAFDSLADIGSRYEAHRHDLMLARQEGLTKTYNRFHDQRETAADIGRLRELRVELDQAVAEAYGWTDFDLGHGFRETKQGLRFTISEPARIEVLDRLLELNHLVHGLECRRS